MSPQTMDQTSLPPSLIKMYYDCQCLDLAICKGLQIHRVEMVVMKCQALVETISRSWKQSHDF